MRGIAGQSPRGHTEWARWKNFRLPGDASRASPPPIAKRPGGKGSDLSTRRPPSCREFYPRHSCLGALPPLFSRWFLLDDFESLQQEPAAPRLIAERRSPCPSSPPPGRRRSPVGLPKQRQPGTGNRLVISANSCVFQPRSPLAGVILWIRMTCAELRRGQSRSMTRRGGAGTKKEKKSREKGLTGDRTFRIVALPFGRNAPRTPKSNGLTVSGGCPRMVGPIRAQAL